MRTTLSIAALLLWVLPAFAQSGGYVINSYQTFGDGSAGGGGGEAVVSSTIGAAGDFTTIGAWLASDAGTGNVNGDGALAVLDAGNIAQGVLIDNTTYSEQIDVNTGRATTATSYVWITAAEGVRHNGTAGSGARIHGAGDHVIHVFDDYTRISNVEIKQVGTGSSHEGVRVAAHNVLIERAIIWTANATQLQDCIYVPPGDVTLSVHNSIIYDCFRGGIHVQFDGAGNTATINVDYTTIYGSGSGGSANGHSNIFVESSNVGNDITVNLYNNTFGGSPNLSDLGDAHNSGGVPSGTVAWNGSNNIYEDVDIQGSNNLTASTVITAFSDDPAVSGSYVVVQNLISGSEDFRLQAANDGTSNAAVDGATDRTGLEPDSRQDFSLDVTNTARTGTFDAGADEL